MPSALPVRSSASLLTAQFTFVLVANLVPLMTVPTVLPELQAGWHLSASEAGWLGGIYFAGYALAAPLVASAADRSDGRWLLAGSSLLGAAASLAFGLWADGFCSGCLLRLASGAAMAGVHMPGLKMLADRLEGPAQARGAAVYTSSYALGNAGSSLVAGAVTALFDWQASFIAGGLAPLLALPVIGLVPSTAKHAATPIDPVAFRPLLRNRAVVAYILGFAGNTWEVFAIRVWFVASLAWTIGLPGNGIELPNLGIVSGLAALAGVPVSVAVAELAARHRRSTVIAATCAVSVVVCLALAATTGGSVFVVLPLLVLLQVSSFADVGALAGGIVAASEPRHRGKVLGLYATAGFASGFLGPTVVGTVIEQFGGIRHPEAWSAAFVTMALGSMVAGWSVWRSKRSLESQ
jgi:MFS family permease